MRGLQIGVEVPPSQQPNRSRRSQVRLKVRYDTGHERSAEVVPLPALVAYFPAPRKWFDLVALYCSEEARLGSTGANPGLNRAGLHTGLHVGLS